MKSLSPEVVFYFYLQIYHHIWHGILLHTLAGALRYYIDMLDKLQVGGLFFILVFFGMIRISTLIILHFFLLQLDSGILCLQNVFSFNLNCFKTREQTSLMFRFLSVGFMYVCFSLYPVVDESEPSSKLNVKVYFVSSGID